ncbi:hypothetical protein NLI96_g11607 [Meripilus lineatus]|uniref:Uncharacterized protein n=1 Tax=Meripilus lineatus TaxID=2056292 RepID=A0AAD5URJ4_9APHY|nr:hypothetical protein NLI96_g11607 [Physisporinus lineatus]
MWFTFRAGIYSHPYSRLVELEIASRFMVPFLHDLTLLDKKAKSAVQALDIPLLRRAIARLDDDLSVALDTLSSATYRPVGILPIETQIQMLATIQGEMGALERGLEMMMGALAKLERTREEAIALGRKASDSKGGA